MRTQLVYSPKTQRWFQANQNATKCPASSVNTISKILLLPSSVQLKFITHRFMCYRRVKLDMFIEKSIFGLPIS